MPEKGLGLAKNETFFIPSNIFFFPFVVRECSAGIPKAHVQNGMIPAWLWWLFLSLDTLRRAICVHPQWDMGDF